MPGEIKVQLGRNFQIAGMENLTGYLKSFAYEPFSTTVKAGKHSFGVLYNEKKEWIVFDSDGPLDFQDHSTPASSAWVFSRPEAVEAFLSYIRVNDGTCKVSKPVFASNEVVSINNINVDLSLRLDESKVGSNPKESAPINITIESDDEDPYVCLMGGF